MSCARNQLPLGIIHFMAFPQVSRGEGPVVETLQILVDDPDFSFLEVTHIEDAGARREAAAMLRASGKRYAFGAQPVLLSRKLSLVDPDEAGRMAAVDAMKRAVDEANEIGAESLAFLSGTDPGQENRAEGYRLLADSTLRILAYAKAKNPALKLLLETFDRVPYGKNALVGPTREANIFVTALRRQYPEFSLLLDLSHLPLLGETAEKMLTTAKETLGHIHIGNCVMKDPNHAAYGDEHPPFGIDGGENGVGELAEFLRVLGEIGYLNEETPGAVSFEVKPLPGQDPAEVIASSKATLDAAWAQLGWPLESVAV
ncbi:MAG: sugar phosphate isomerase/epimerase family protein [Armatimonadota bacterium]